MSAQVRRIAILVTSLDSAAGRQLLMAMPSGLARDVRKAMASLTAVDPQEQRQVLAEFRNQALSSTASTSATAAADAASAKRTASTSAATIARPNASGGAEPTAAHAAAETNLSTNQSANSPNDDLSYAAGEGARPWAQLDVTALTDLLRGERPLVIAVVLSQLQPRQAARLLEQFPRQQHRAVIAHLTSLGNIDPEAMQAIDEHLASRIADYHHRSDSQSESAGRMQELLAAASPELRGHWQEIIADSDHQLAKRLGIEVVAKAAHSQSRATAPSMPRAEAAAHASSRSNLIDMLANNIVTTADAQMDSLKAQTSEVQPAETQSVDHDPVVLPFPAPSSAASVHAAKDSASEIATLDQILELPPRTIARVLSAADGEVLLLALAGATPTFMQRFTGMLEKQDARTLQACLSKLGAINLQDVDEAQRRLCELASHIVGQMRFRRPAAATARAAA